LYSKNLNKIDNMDNSKTYIYIFLITATIVYVGCQTNASKEEDSNYNQFSYDLGVVGGFCELIDAGVKQLALSAPLQAGLMDDFIVDAEKVASRHNVLVYRESDLIVTDLFPSDIAADKDVLLLFTGTTKEEYFALKKDREELEEAGKYSGEARLEIARRFGRMLSYSPRKINQLISQNSSFKTMFDFGIRASNLFLYYKDLEKATKFYAETLGMELLSDYRMAKIFRMAAESYLILVDADEGMHTAEEPKTVALALLTDQLDEWYEYLKNQNVRIKYDYKPKNSGPHDGFVIYDPEGYLLEFERFYQHPENERFIPLLKGNATLLPSSDQKNSVPDGLGFHSTITWLYYKDILGMQNFYQDVLGLEMVADQGWTKIYQVTNSAFIGLVDERRGMHSFTEEKAVTLSFILDDLEAWYNYSVEHQPFELRSEMLEVDSQNRYKAFVGYDPEGYFMEFDAFYPHEDNTKLID